MFVYDGGSSAMRCCHCVGVVLSESQRSLVDADRLGIPRISLWLLSVISYLFYRRGKLQVDPGLSTFNVGMCTILPYVLALLFVEIDKLCI